MIKRMLLCVCVYVNACIICVRGVGRVFPLSCEAVCCAVVMLWRAGVLPLYFDDVARDVIRLSSAQG